MLSYYSEQANISIIFGVLKATNLCTFPTKNYLYITPSVDQKFGGKDLTLEVCI